MCPAKGEQAPGEELRALREAAGLTQAEAAKRLGMDTGTLSRKERGQNATTKTDLLAARAVLVPGGSAGANGLGELPSDAGETGRPDLRRTVAYWVGRQEMSVEMMQAAAGLQGEVASMQQRAAQLLGEAIKAQRELMANTLPIPPAPREDPRTQAERDAQFLEDMKKARRELDARAAGEKRPKKRPA